MTLPFAHQTWFEKGAHTTDWGFATETTTLLLLLAAVVLTLVVRLLSR